MNWCGRVGGLLGDNIRRVEAAEKEGGVALIWPAAARRNERAAGDWR